MTCLVHSINFLVRTEFIKRCMATIPVIMRGITATWPGAAETCQSNKCHLNFSTIPVYEVNSGFGCRNFNDTVATARNKPPWEPSPSRSFKAELDSPFGSYRLRRHTLTGVRTNHLNNVFRIGNSCTDLQRARTCPLFHRPSWLVLSYAFIHGQRNLICLRPVCTACSKLYS